jgi:hypothetical protein
MIVMAREIKKGDIVQLPDPTSNKAGVGTWHKVEATRHDMRTGIKIDGVWIWSHPATGYRRRG